MQNTPTPFIKITAVLLSQFFVPDLSSGVLHPQQVFLYVFFCIPTDTHGYTPAHAKINV